MKVAAGTADGGVKLSGPVKLPTSAISPSKSKTLGAGVGGGLILGLGLGFLAEYLDGTVKDARDLARALPSVPILAVVPRPQATTKKKKTWRRRSRGANGRTLFPEGAVEQAYETAAVAIAAQERDHQLNSIVVVAAPEEPAVTQAIGLARGDDQHRPDRGARGCEPTRAESAGEAGPGRPRSRRCRERAELRWFPSIRTRVCAFIGSGLDPQKHLPPLPDLHEALDYVSKAADVAVLCADPVLTYSDAMVLAGETSGTVLVARTRHTTRLALQQSLDRLTKVRSDVIGVILDNG